MSTVVTNDPDTVLEANVIGIMQLLVNDKFITLIGDGHDRLLGAVPCKDGSTIKTMAQFCMEEIAINSKTTVFLEYYSNGDAMTELSPSVKKVYEDVLPIGKVRPANFRDTFKPLPVEQQNKRQYKEYFIQLINFLYNAEASTFKTDAIDNEHFDVIEEYQLHNLHIKLRYILWGLPRELNASELVDWKSQNPMNPLLYEANIRVLDRLNRAIFLLKNYSGGEAVALEIMTHIKYIYQMINDIELIKIVVQNTDPAIIIMGTEHAWFIRDILTQCPCTVILNPWQDRHQIRDCISLYRIVSSVAPPPPPRTARRESPQASRQVSNHRERMKRKAKEARQAERRSIN